MENEKVIGGWCLSNFGGLSVLEMTDEYMIVRWYDEKETEQCEILFEQREDAEEGDDLEACISYHGRLYFLSDCMRTNF